MFCLLYIGPLRPDTIQYLNWVNDYVPVGLISDRRYENLSVNFFRTFQDPSVLGILHELELDLELFLNKPYKLCDLRPYSVNIFKTAGADLSNGFGYFDLDLVISLDLLKKVSKSKRKELFSTGVSEIDFGHFRYYSNMSEDLSYDLRKFLTSNKHHLKSKMNYALDETCELRMINDCYPRHLVKGFDQNIYSFGLKNNFTKKRYKRIEYCENVHIDGQYFDYFHMQKRGFYARKSFRLFLKNEIELEVKRLLKVFFQRLKSKLVSERRVKRRYR